MFQVKENTKEKLIVSCTIPPKKYGTDKDVHIDLSNIVTYVIEQNIPLGEGQWAKVATLYNYTKNPRLTAEFIFVKKQEEKSLTVESASDIIKSDIKGINIKPKKRTRRSARGSRNTTGESIFKED